MSISSIGSSSASIQSRQMQRPDPAKMASDLFGKLNTDGSGGISASELESALSSATGASSTDASSQASSMIKGLDSDGDGQVSQDELTSGFKQLAAQFDDHFNASRTSGMGQPPSPQQVFSGIDGDGSGGISQQELATALGQAQGAGSSSTSSSAGSTDGSTSTEASSNADALFKALDTDGDGSVSQDELASGMEKTGGHGHGHHGMGGTGAASGQDGGPPPVGGMSSASGASGASGSSSSASSTSDSTSYDPADANQDGTVSDAERLAYQQKTADSSGSDATGAAASQNDMLKHMLMQLAHAYGGAQTATQSGSTVSVAA